MSLLSAAPWRLRLFRVHTLWTFPSNSRNYPFSTLIELRQRTHPLSVGQWEDGKACGRTKLWQTLFNRSQHLIAQLQYCLTRWMWLPEHKGEKGGSGRKLGREQWPKCSFNMVKNNESGPHRLDLPLPFLPLQPGFRYLELLISPCVPLQVRREIRSEVFAVSAIWACCSFRSYFISGQPYLSFATAWMHNFLSLWKHNRPPKQSGCIALFFFFGVGVVGGGPISHLD